MESSTIDALEPAQAAELLPAVTAVVEELEGILRQQDAAQRTSPPESLELELLEEAGTDIDGRSLEAIRKGLLS